MRINSINTNNFIKNSKPSFGAAFSEELEYKYKKLGYEILFRTGQDSKEYQIYEASIKGLKRLCYGTIIYIKSEKKWYEKTPHSEYCQSIYNKIKKEINIKKDLEEYQILEENLLNIIQKYQF